MQFISFGCAVNNSKEITVAGMLVAVKFFHEQWVGVLLPLSHAMIKAVREGTKMIKRGSRQYATGNEASGVGCDGGDGAEFRGVGSGGGSC